MAVPAVGKAARSAAINRYKVDTWKKRIVRSGMRGVLATGMDRLLFESSAHPLGPQSGVDVQTWLGEVRLVLSKSDLQAIFIWPPQSDRGRVYVHLVDALGNAYAFAKISYDEKNDVEFEREAAAIRRVMAFDCRSFSVPELLLCERVADSLTLIVSPLSNDAQPIDRDLSNFPQDAVLDFAGPLSEVDIHDNQPWWWERLQMLAERSVGASRFLEVIQSLSDQPITTGFVHGDFGVHNILTANGSLFIIDWEDSSEAAPFLTDVIGFAMSVNSTAIINEEEKIVCMAPKITSESENLRRDILLGLAYRFVSGFEDARQAIDEWE